MPAEPDVVERERAKAELGHKDGSRGIQPLDDGTIFCGNAIAVRLGTVSGGNAGGVEEILCSLRNSVERAAIFACCDFRVGLTRLFQRMLAGQGDDAAELWIELFQAVKINLRQALRGDLAAFNPAREL